MDRTFTLAEARGLMPEVRRRAADYIRVRADYAEVNAALQSGARSEVGGLPELKGLEARLHEELDWFSRQGIQVKGIAPLLVDFPALADGQQVLLCWLEGESALDWYHRPELGFMGRRRIAELRSP